MQVVVSGGLAMSNDAERGENTDDNSVSQVGKKPVKSTTTPNTLPQNASHSVSPEKTASNNMHSKSNNSQNGGCQEDQPTPNAVALATSAVTSSNHTNVVSYAGPNETVKPSLTTTSTQSSEIQKCVTHSQSLLMSVSENCVQNTKEGADKEKETIGSRVPTTIHPRPAMTNNSATNVSLNTINSRRTLVTSAKTQAASVTSEKVDNSDYLARVQPMVAGTDISNRLISPLVTSTTPPPISTVQVKSGKSGALRRGKWTVEEEAYVARVIQDFNSGFLNAPAGTTLRSYLSEKLQCDPMRITKKFTGDSCIGKRVFHPAVRSASNAAAIDKAQSELDALERRWRRRLELQQRESVKKAAASAAAAAVAAGRMAASSGRIPASNRMHGFVQQTTLGPTVNGQRAVVLPVGQMVGQNVVTQTASWLDRASTILKGTGGSCGDVTSEQTSGTHLDEQNARDLESLPKREIENQMKEVERLIHEGPLIQQTSAGLPHILDHHGGTSVTTGARIQVEETEPADKRLRTGAEDAEALVGFLTAVRASAASGRESFAN